MTGGSLLIITQCVPFRSRPSFEPSPFLGPWKRLFISWGLLFGGAITDKASWRRGFWINLPVGAVPAIVVELLLKPTNKSILACKLTLGERLRRFDWLGLLTRCPTTLVPIIALQWGGSEYSGSDARVTVPLSSAAILRIVLLGIQILISPGKAATPSRVLESRSVVSGALFPFSHSSIFAIWTSYLLL
ncbi:hypothetical protein F4778DRAFT_184806 [Xylariomycetidae sp. FL2044]|nr:hypothetical protein F4778DRAFT_184806 [Xylariomycetidae sp. FL2044]